MAEIDGINGNGNHEGDVLVEIVKILKPDLM
jgi:hypothetical protein